MPEKFNLTTGLELPTKEKIREMRLKAELSQEQCAKIIGVSGRYRWSEYERGLSPIEINKWAAFLLAVDLHPIYSLKPAERRKK